ncbi:hypothetical protein [Metabacillus malikii]|uniref:Bacteriocin n=1 Tax=Metabacillus malikii TaxID=1504265 RepID=A0ABT9ZES0_9BACI|nr:hypothetical protein [Metabacillus malikii]MDQ0230738.1 hypothetical protein [Metabacillus malikii]
MELMEIKGMRELHKEEMTEIDGGFVAIAYWAARGAYYVATNPAARAAVAEGVAWFGAGVTGYTVWDALN